MPFGDGYERKANTSSFKALNEEEKVGTPLKRSPMESNGEDPTQFQRIISFPKPRNAQNLDRQEHGASGETCKRVAASLRCVQHEEIVSFTASCSTARFMLASQDHHFR